MVRFFGVNVDDYGLFCRRNRLIGGRLAASCRPRRGLADAVQTLDFGRFSAGRLIRQVQIMTICVAADDIHPRDAGAADQGRRGTRSAFGLAGEVGGSPSSHS
jgi:hypothetical protein